MFAFSKEKVNIVTYVQTQIKEYTFLGPKGLFVTIPEHPEFCWQELIVNAVAHRNYSINRPHLLFSSK
ncbi:hypothetical protein C3V39_01105 [Prevotella sp. oral taxon 820]|nr:hypothetical protein C3V39_01105 [Prevotella sp. oral taxon 820]